MCGIFGFQLTKEFKYERTNIINKFRSHLYLRGPDSFSYKSFENNTIGISRLSIVDINNQSQPFILESEELQQFSMGKFTTTKI